MGSSPLEPEPLPRARGFQKLFDHGSIGGFFSKVLISFWGYGGFHKKGDSPGLTGMMVQKKIIQSSPKRPHLFRLVKHHDVPMNIHIYIYVYINIRVYTYVCLSIYVCTRTYVYIYIYIHIYPTASNTFWDCIWRCSTWGLNTWGYLERDLPSISSMAAMKFFTQLLGGGGDQRAGGDHGAWGGGGGVLLSRHSAPNVHRVTWGFIYMNLVGGLGCHFVFSQKYWEFHHPNWRTHIFQRGFFNHQPDWHTELDICGLISRGLGIILVSKSNCIISSNLRAEGSLLEMMQFDIETQLILKIQLSQDLVKLVYVYVYSIYIYISLNVGWLIFDPFFVMTQFTPRMTKFTPRVTISLCALLKASGLMVPAQVCCQFRKLNIAW